jgi:hypothetical protein
LYGSTGHFCQACGALEQRAVSIGDVEPEAFFAKLYATSWVVYAKRPFGGAEQVIRYLSRYTHRVAISNARIEDVATDGVRFRTKTGQQVTLAPEEFLRRLLLHVLPRGFTKIATSACSPRATSTDVSNAPAACSRQHRPRCHRRAPPRALGKRR